MKEFHEVFSENSEHQDFKPLLQHMKVVDAYLQSMLEEAIRKNRNSAGKGEKGQAEVTDENETLLDHLVKYTDGKSDTSVYLLISS